MVQVGYVTIRADAASLRREIIRMKVYERYFPNMKALHHTFQTAPCFVCEIIGSGPDRAAHIVYEDDRFIAFLDKYPRQYGYTLISPKRHLEQVTAAFDLGDYLALQTLVYHVCEAVREEVDAERMYIFTFGSNQGNAHVHWHVAPLPKGTPYEQQQGAAVGWQAGVLRIPETEMAVLADRLRKRIEERVNN
jgi:diadenosine tetraphosphate (Ap4A) HIT family hydrolase